MQTTTTQYCPMCKGSPNDGPRPGDVASRSCPGCGEPLAYHCEKVIPHTYDGFESTPTIRIPGHWLNHTSQDCEAYRARQFPTDFCTNCFQYVDFATHDNGVCQPNEQALAFKAVLARGRARERRPWNRLVRAVRASLRTDPGAGR